MYLTFAPGGLGFTPATPAWDKSGEEDRRISKLLNLHTTNNFSDLFGFYELNTDIEQKVK